MTLGAGARRTLLGTARESVSHGLSHASPPPIEPQRYPAELRSERASFATLTLDGRLRGCMGGLKAHQALVRDVAEHAYMAAFSDPRFAPVSKDELEPLRITLSVLSERTPVRFESEDALLEQLVPGEDGLVIAKGGHRATFLPAVWTSLPEPRRFLDELKRKAGLSAGCVDYRAWRYTTESFSEPDA